MTTTIQESTSDMCLSLHNVLKSKLTTTIQESMSDMCLSFHNIFKKLQVFLKINMSLYTHVGASKVGRKECKNDKFYQNMLRMYNIIILDHKRKIHILQSEHTTYKIWLRYIPS